MSRYIDADIFKRSTENAMEKMHLIAGVKAVDVGAVIKAIDLMPTADVVEVVRCKDCKHWKEISVDNLDEYDPLKELLRNSPIQSLGVGECCCKHWKTLEHPIVTPKILYIERHETNENDFAVTEKGEKMELNAEQIKKALECCVSLGGCQKCSYRERGSITCMYDLRSDALSLINSQEQRIGAQDMTISELRKRVEKAEHDADRYAQRIKELTQANEQLSESYDHLEKTKDELLAERSRLTEENERLRAENKALVNDNAEIKNHIQEEISEEDINLFDEFTKLLHEGIREAKANNVSEIKTRFAMRFGTYTDKDMTPITEVFRLLDQIAKETLEG